MGSEPLGSDGTLDPDASEEELAAELDNGVRSRSYALTRVVGLGGSAGSIQALQRFFEAMPAQPGMAFVVIVHLSPDHESSLGELLQRATSMPVQVATDGRKILPNHVYVLPPAKHLSLTDGQLRLTELPRAQGRRLTVDLFFRSLADTYGARAIGVVFSGLDGDGALGVKRIKERGGLTVAQDPDEAEQPSMPRSAIDTSMVDWVLEVGEMPERLLEYHARERRLQLPPESGPNPAAALGQSPSEDEAALRDVLAFLRARTARDFSYYKRATIVRRIARRMQVNEIDDLATYLSNLRMHPGEAGALLRDLLISVTNFFRDREAFEALEARIPELFRDKTQLDTVRVWVPACATGEEAYAIAMLLSEHARTLETPPTLQVFATDIDGAALSEARSGLFPLSISADVSTERLHRFFVREHRSYRVRRELREILLFAVHDVLKDPPFSRLDLISCRNLLIYLNRDAQRRAFEIFHFALRREARLFLGTSESADDVPQLFVAIDKKHRMYQARATGRTSPPLPSRQSSLARAIAIRDAAEVGTSLARQQPPQLDPVLGNLLADPSHARAPWSELHLKLIERTAPPSLLIDDHDDVLHLTENAAPFLKFSGGEPSTHLYRVVHPALRAELRAALYRARETDRTAVTRGIPVEVDGRQRLIDLRVLPALDLAPDFWLILLETNDIASEDERTAASASEPAAHHIERELDQTKRHLREVIDRHESSTEELKASNEELQAINEELRSATEELETGREELQSINEELSTVNHELKTKVDELGQSNSHLHNLMAATAIATVFLDRELRIMRYTPPAVELFSLMAADVGRPLVHLRHHLDYADLFVDAARVLKDLSPIEREVGERGGRYFLARLLPYRTIEGQIAGVVLTFVDVSELHAVQAALRDAQQELERRVQQRTAQLDRVNAALRAEVAMHQDAQKARLELQRRLVSAQEQERIRISRELHDEVGQQITALMLALKSVESDLSDGVAREKFRNLRTIAEQVGHEIHQLATQLRPVALDELGLFRALSGYLENWGARSGISVDFVDSGIEANRLSSAVETTLYRIVQEATNNVLKHARAKNVSVSVERRVDHVLAIVEDDGSGFDVNQHPADASRIGIAGMRERASIIGGDLTIESRIGGGTTVRVRLPLTLD